MAGILVRSIFLACCLYLLEGRQAPGFNYTVLPCGLIGARLSPPFEEVSVGTGPSRVTWSMTLTVTHEHFHLTEGKDLREEVQRSPESLKSLTVFFFYKIFFFS